MNQKSRLDKSLTAVALLIIVGALVIIANTPSASGYELSIYNVYPGYFWFLFILSLALGIVIIIRQSLMPLKGKWWLAGLGIVILSNIIFLAIPFLRNYAIYPSGDAITHLSIISDIIETGSYSDQNFYPIVHVLGVEISLVTGISGSALVTLMSISWYVIYLLNVYLLALVLANNHRQAIFIVALASPLIYGIIHSSIQPNIFSIFMLPLLLYLHHKRKQTPSGTIFVSILFFLVAAFVTFTHPVTLLFIVIVFFMLELGRIFYHKFITNKGIDMQDSIGAGGFSAALIMLVLFSLWYFQQPTTEYAIRSAYDALFLGTSTTVFESMTGNLAEAGLDLFQTIELFIFRYGGVFVYLLAAVVALGVVLRKWITKKADIKQTEFIYSLLIIAAIGFSAFSMFGFTGELSPIRISRFFLVFSPIIVGLIAYLFIHGGDSKPDVKGVSKPRFYASTVIVALLIIIASSLGISNVYGSTRTMESNSQVSSAAVSGAEWFLTYKDDGIITTSATFDLRRHEQLFFGFQQAADNRSLQDSEWIPTHFGYDTFESIIEAYDYEERYLITWERDRLAPLVFSENVRPLVHQYNTEDYNLLNNDTSAVLIYANGEFEVYYVYE